MKNPNHEALNRQNLIIQAEMTKAYACSFRDQKIKNPDIKRAFLESENICFSENNLFFAKTVFIADEQFIAYGTIVEGVHYLDNFCKRSFTGINAKYLIEFESNFQLMAFNDADLITCGVVQDVAA